jgi:type III secretion protein Q
MIAFDEPVLQESLAAWDAAALTANVLQAAAAPSDATWQALPGVPRLALARAALSARLGRGCSVALDGPGRLGLFADAEGQAQVVDWDDPVQLHGPFGAVQLADGARLLRGLTGIDLGPGAPGAWLCAALLGRLAGTPLAQATRLQRGALGPLDDECILQFILRSEQHSIVCHARASAATWCALLAGADWRRERAALAHFSALPVDARLTLARHTLPGSALAALCEGDLIVPDAPSFDCAGAGVVQIGAARLGVAHAAPNRLTILSVEPDMEQQDSMESAALPFDDWQEEGAAVAVPAEARLPDALLGSVPVTLDFVLGRVRLPLGRLQELGPGSVIEILGGSPADIAIEANGQRLGRAEIVNVAGRLGVRVVQWGGLS